MPNVLAKYAQLNQKNLIQKFAAEFKKTSTIIFLRAASHENRKWTDAELPFRQESNFFWLTGCNEADFAFTLDPVTSKTSLFLPEYEADHALWNGSLLTAPQAQDRYHADQVLYASDLAAHLNGYETVMVIEKEELGISTAVHVLLMY